MGREEEPKFGSSKNPPACPSQTYDHKNDQHHFTHQPASDKHPISHSLDLQNFSQRPIHHHQTHNPVLATHHTTGRPGTAEMLAELSKNVTLTHGIYRKIDIELDRAIENLVQHLASKNFIEEQLTTQDWSIRTLGVIQRESIEVIYPEEEIYADHLKVAGSELGALLIEERADYQSLIPFNLSPGRNSTITTRLSQRTSDFPHQTKLVEYEICI